MPSKLKTMLGAGVPFGVLMGAVFIWRYGYVVGAIAGVAAGLLFGGALAAFVKKQDAKAPEGELVPGEPIRHQGPANHFVPGDATGGRLFLTDKRLYFKSHGFNRKDHELTIPLVDVAGAEGGRSLGIIPNRLVVRLRDGRRETFVVWGRDAWLAVIGGKSDARS